VSNINNTPRELFELIRDLTYQGCAYDERDGTHRLTHAFIGTYEEAFIFLGIMATDVSYAEADVMIRDEWPEFFPAGEVSE